MTSTRRRPCLGTGVLSSSLRVENDPDIELRGLDIDRRRLTRVRTSWNRHTRL